MAAVLMEPNVAKKKEKTNIIAQIRMKLYL